MKKSDLNWVILGDCHLGARSDSKIFHKIQKDFFNDQLFPYLEKHQVKTLITLGDFFDRRKFINYETLKIAKESFFDRLKEMGVSVHMIIGNHDTYYKNTNRVNSVQLLISENDYPNVRVYSEPETVTIDQVRVLMMPWINQENYEKTLNEIRDTNARFVVSHLEMKGFEYFRGVVSDHGHLDEEMLGRFEAVWTGHYHTKSSKGNIHYLGTPYEMNWSDYNDPKGFHHFNGSRLTFIENPKKIFVKVFYNDKDRSRVEKGLEQMDSFQDRYVKLVIREKNHPILFERFLDGILATNPINVNVIDETNKIQEVLESGELPSDTLEIVENFIYENLETDLTKDVILDKIRKIYYLAKETSEDE